MKMVDAIDEELTSMIETYLKGLLLRGFQLPVYVSLMRSAGGFVIIRYENDEDGRLAGETLHRAWPPGTLIPMHFLFVDRVGKADLAIMQGRGELEPMLPGSEGTN